MNKLTAFLIFNLIIDLALAQNITGHFPELAGQAAILSGFNGLDTYVVDSTTVDDKGVFKLQYGQKDRGMGYLISSIGKPYTVVLSGEEVMLMGGGQALHKTIKVVHGHENRLFAQYASEHPRREQALSAWNYLERIYTQDSLFIQNLTEQKAIVMGQRRIKTEDSLFLARIPEESYVKWFLPIRKLLSSVSVVAQYRPEEIPATLEALRKIDYTDGRLYKSGLLKEAIENHIWFIENSSGPLDSVYVDMKTSIDLMVDQLLSDGQRLNEVGKFLFNLLEKRSLFTASEHLALRLLSEENCPLTDNLSNQLEAYRKMKPGNTAPDIVFNEGTYFPNHVKAGSLAGLTSDHTLVVFAAGWCPNCIREIPKLAKMHKDWQTKGMEIVLVSLDESREDFEQFVSQFPFISTCDYKKWQGKAVQDYHVYGTPTMYLLDQDRKILLRPNSVEHLKAWLEAYLEKK